MPRALRARGAAPRQRADVVLNAVDPRFNQPMFEAYVGMGVEPGLSDVFARYAADHLYLEIDEGAVRDGADLVVEGYACAHTFSIWTTIQKCLNPVVALELPAAGTWSGAGVREPEALPADPFLELPAEYRRAARSRRTNHCRIERVL